MKKEDFNVVANGRGYQVQYRGQNIGGAGISGEAKSPRGRAVWKQVQDYLSDGQADITAILNGTGQQRFLDEIARIGTNP